MKNTQMLTLFYKNSQKITKNYAKSRPQSLHIVILPDFGMANLLGQLRILLDNLLFVFCISPVNFSLIMR